MYMQMQVEFKDVDVECKIQFDFFWCTSLEKMTVSPT